MSSICRTQQWLHELRTAGRSEASRTKAITDASCKAGDIFSQCLKNTRLEPTPSELSEDILFHIYSLMSVQDAARAACVSHGFLSSWRCYPNLIFNNQTLGLNKRWLDMDEKACEVADTESYVINKIDHILKNHSGIGVKVLKFELFPCPNINASNLDRWFEFIVKPGIEELALVMSTCEKRTEYNFPCSLLSNMAGGGTLKSLCLSSCSFHPTVTLGYNRSLTSLDLWSVHISGEELGQFISSCLVLEQLAISACNDIVCLKVPCPLQKLHCLKVSMCATLKVVEINAPKLSTFMYEPNKMQISLGDPLQVKLIRIFGYLQDNMVFYARTELPSIMPNVETLDPLRASVHQWSPASSSASSTWVFIFVKQGAQSAAMISFLLFLS